MTKMRWYDLLLNKIHNSYTEKIIIEDYDELGSNEEIIEALSNEYAIHIYKGELLLRKFVSQQTGKQILIFIKSPSIYLPYEIEASSDRIAWKLNDIFPDLNIPTIKQFSPCYNQIYRSYKEKEDTFGEFNDIQTLQWILLWLWSYDTSKMRGIEDAIYLIYHSYGSLSNVPIVVSNLISQRIHDFPTVLFAGKDEFLKWLSDEWRNYVDSVSRLSMLYEVNFGCPILKPLVEQAFKEHILMPYSVEDSNHAIQDFLSENSWAKWGVELARTFDNNDENYIKLITEISSMLRQQVVDWGMVGYKWGKLSYLKDLYDINCSDMDNLDKEIHIKFKDYVKDCYRGLFFESYYNKPKTLDKVMHYIGQKGDKKKVLICIDCMGFQEWFAINECLKQKMTAKFDVSPIFAMLPSITSYSRLSLFAGKIPKEISGVSENKAFKEHIKQFWYQNDDSSNRLFINASTADSKLSYQYDNVGIIFNFVDNLVHGTEYVNPNKRLMQKNLINVLEEIKLHEVIQGYIDNNFRVFITSDHGSIWCIGNGKKLDKYLVDSRARRVLVYNDFALAQEYAEKNDLFIYQNSNLIGNQVLILPEFRDMFAKEGTLAISHGGIHIEEVIVPFVEVFK